MTIQPQRCREYAWHSEVTQDDISAVPTTMLSNGEKLMLHWLTRNMDLSEGGCIVDAGCFLGGSTLALATGLSRNPAAAKKDFRIHTYDMFLAPNDDYSLGLIGNGKKPGDTVLDLFAKNLGPLAPYVAVHVGDFMEMSPPQRPIDILFIDIAKTRDLNAKMILEFFPLLVPGRSVVVQQDHNDHSCPWVNSTMQKLHEYFDILCDDGSSRLYALTRAIPADVLAAAAGVSLQEEFDLLQHSAQTDNREFGRFFTAVSAAWTVLEKDGATAAIQYLDQVSIVQPWESDTPYRDLVRGSINHVEATGGMQRYHDDYFEAHPA